MRRGGPAEETFWTVDLVETQLQPIVRSEFFSQRRPEVRTGATEELDLCVSVHVSVQTAKYDAVLG